MNEEHLTFHLQYEHSRMLAYRKYEELKKSEIVLPHHSQPSRENATPSSDTSLLASYKDVRPPPPRAHDIFTADHPISLGARNLSTGVLESLT